MPDHYAKLTRAVVEIGTQLRRIADAQTTPVADDTNAPTTTPDDAPHLRQLIADALEAADYRPDMRRGDLADAVLPVILPLGRTLRGLHHSAEEDATEWAHRAEEQRRRAEQADAVTAETKRLLDRRTTTLRQRAERAEKQRDRLITAARNVLHICGDHGSDVQDILKAALADIGQPATQEQPNAR